MVGFLAASVSFGAVNPSLKSEILENVSPDLSTVELDELHQDFVVVKFSIKDFQIKIIEIQGSQESLIQLIIHELSEIFVQREYSETDVYNYKFVFKKS
jgi:hypothetical protein